MGHIIGIHKIIEINDLTLKLERMDRENGNNLKELCVRPCFNAYQFNNSLYILNIFIHNIYGPA